MTLPFSDRMPMQPLMVYAANAPPFVPNVQTTDAMRPHVPTIASAIANNVTGSASKSGARMFVYNLLSNQNWANNEFSELVQFATDLMRLRLNKGDLQYPQQGYDSIADEAVMLFISRKIAEYPDLRSILDPRVVNAATSNIIIFNNLSSEINNMNNGQFPQQMIQVPNSPGMMQYPQPIQQMVPMQSQVPQQNLVQIMTPNGPMWIHPSQLQGQMQPQVQMQPQIMVDPRLQYGVGQPRQMPVQNIGQGGMGQSPVINNLEGEDNRFSRRVAAKVQQPQPEVKKEEPKVMVDEKSWRPSAAQPYRTLIDSRSFKRTYNQQGQHVIEVIQPLGENEMDRSKHAITVLGKTFPMDTPARIDRVKENVVEMASITKSALKNLESSAIAEEIKTYVQPAWFLDTFVEAAIFEGRLQHREQLTQSECSVFRCFATICRPIITSPEVHERAVKANEDLMTARSFAEIAMKLKSYGQSASSISNNDESQRKDMTKFVEFCHEIDVMLTEVVNDFLSKKLSLSGVRLESFSEDITSLRRYLEDKYSAHYAAAFDRFEHDIAASIFHQLGSENEAQLADAINTAPESPVTVSFIPVNHSFTYLNVLDRELNIEVKNGESLLIAEGISPMLFKVAKSLFEQSEIPALYNVLITADNVRYLIHKGYLGMDAYLISKYCC